MKPSVAVAEVRKIEGPSLQFYRLAQIVHFGDFSRLILDRLDENGKP